MLRSRFTVLLPVVTLLLTFTPAVGAGDLAPTDLSAPFEMTMGHVFALYLYQALQTAAGLDQWDAPISTLYDPARQRVDIELLGARTSVESAKESMERFRKDLLGLALIGANRMCGTNVTVQQVSIVYVNRKQWKEIIRYADGTYTTPD